MKHLFGRNTVNDKRQNTRESPIRRKQRSSRSIDIPSVEAELKSLCGQNSHPDYPLLRVGYVPGSRYPAVDFTPWIAQKLTERRFQDIAYLLVQLTLANPGMGFGVDPDYWNEHWTRQALKLCNINLFDVIECGDNNAILDLHAALFPYILHGALDGFMLVDHVDFLARAISPYGFSVYHLETKVKAANQFIRKMRKETKEHSTAWTDYPLLRVKDFNGFLSSTIPASKLRAKLQRVSIGARLLFFGTLRDGPGQGHWIARPYGINEGKAAMELTEVGLGELQGDPVLVLMTYHKGELLEALEGYPTKQGWNKKYIAKYMAENAPEVLEKLTEGKSVFALQVGVNDEGEALASWISKTTVLLAIALGFLE